MIPSPPLLRRVLAAALALALSGCGLLVDGAYLLGDGRYSDSAEERAPTGETAVRMETDLAREADGALVLGCTRRTREVERSWQVTRTFQHQGSFDADTYAGTAMLDGLLGTLIAGTLLTVCQQDDSNLSCWNAVWAAPFALDLGYSLVRRATAEPAVLVDKSRSADRLRYAEPPLAEEPATCDWVTSLWIGGATGPSDEALLSGEGTGTRALADGAIELSLGPDGLVTLSPEAATSWAGQSWATVWALDAEGVPHPVRADRCALLRDHAGGFTGTALETFQIDCPLPQPATPGGSHASASPPPR